MEKINGVLLTVVGHNGKVSQPGYEAHSIEKIIEIINATWRIEHVTDITDVKIY
jgi:hypothetical protein